MRSINFTHTLWSFLAATLLALLPHPLLAQEAGDPANGQDVVKPADAPAPADPRFESPLATMLTILDSARQLASGQLPDNEKTRVIQTLARAFGMEPTNVPGVRDASARLTFVLNRLGDINAEQLPDAAALENLSLVEFPFFPHDHQWYSRPLGYTNVLDAYPEGELKFIKTARAEWILARSSIEGLPAFQRRLLRLPIVTNDPIDSKQISRVVVAESLLYRLGLGELVDRSFLQIELWKWALVFVFALIGAIVDLIVRQIIRMVCVRAISRRGGKVEKRTLKRTIRPFGLFAAALVWLLGINLFGLPDIPLMVLSVAIRTILAFAGIIALYRIADLVSEYFESKAAKTETSVDDLLVPLVRKAVKIFVTAIGLVYVAEALTIPILPLLSGLGIGGLAVAIAAKDSIENFFGSIAVILDRSFEVGDWVEIDGVEGTVEELGFRSTRIRTFYDSLITVPNAALVRANVDNFGRRTHRRWKTHIGVAYDTPPDAIEAFCEGIRELIRIHPYTRKDYYQVWLHRFGPSSLDILVYVFHDTPDWQTELRERQRLALDILRLAHKLGVEFAFPSQTMYLRRESWAPSDLASESITPSDVEGTAWKQGRDLAKEVTAPGEYNERKPPPYMFTQWGGPRETRGSAE